MRINAVEAVSGAKAAAKGRGKGQKGMLTNPTMHIWGPWYAYNNGAQVIAKASPGENVSGRRARAAHQTTCRGRKAVERQ